jgi:4-amino-4-deoxy-L-arabinose transferase-like glycosyltransferase
VVSSRWRPTDLQLVLLITLAGAALRFATLHVQSFDHDEAVTAGHVLKGSLGGTLDTIPDSERTPPLYYVLAWGWTRIFGVGEVGLRSLSALFGTAMIPAAALVARRFGTGRVAVIAAALVAFCPFLVYYSQEGRAYALLGLLALLSAGAFIRCWREPTPRNLGAWALIGILAIATHYFAGFLVGTEAVLLLVRHQGPRVLAAVGAVAIAAIPLAILAAHQYGVHSTEEPSQQFTARGLETVPVQWALGERLGVHGIYGLTPLLALLFAAVVGLLAWRLWSDRDVGGKLALTLAAGAGVPPILAAIAGTPILAARNLTPALVMLLLAFAVELAALARRREWGIGTALIAGIGLVWAVAATTGVSGLQRPDWRGTAERLGSPPAGGRLLVVPSDASEPLLYYLPNSEEVAEAPQGADTALVVSGVDDVKRIPPTDVSAARDSLGGDAEILFEPASG